MDINDIVKGGDERITSKQKWVEQIPWQSSYL